ncbi:MAG TPA: undecaprenyl-diphosphate phosphatase [Coriobacteriia bacterium]|nr:undecaprenyl-diphosphate phosphatase [Coriobacteriia bacterium]
MDALQAVVLGITQGITEFLPISSDGHLILVPWLLGWKRFGLGFDVVLHGATLLATVAYFRADVARLARGLFSRNETLARDRRLAWVLLAATVPSVIVAFAFEPLVETVETLSMQSQTAITAVFLLLTAALLAGAEWLGRRSRTTVALAEDIDLRRALTIGFAQGFAVAPGLSRSGTTIATGVALGMKRDEAARFSFLLSIPIVTAATAKKVLLDVIIGGEALPPAFPLMIGLITTAIVGYAAIAFLLPYVRRHTLAIFAVYTALVGTAILVARYIF